MKYSEIQNTTQPIFMVFVYIFKAQVMLSWNWSNIGFHKASYLKKISKNCSKQKVFWMDSYQRRCTTLFDSRPCSITGSLNTQRTGMDYSCGFISLFHIFRLVHVWSRTPKYLIATFSPFNHIILHLFIISIR